jgi:hypothetical protein
MAWRVNSIILKDMGSYVGTALAELNNLDI